MAKSEVEYAMEQENPDEDAMDDDKKTVCTVTTSTKTNFIEQEMEESTIRFETPYHEGQSNNNNFQLHVELIRPIGKHFDNTEICFIDNYNQLAKDINEEKWMDL
jgi:hypothetical protein